jgi:UDP-3-O-[3-hydroxymyristoyl] glucosamine N-acyltransferase
MSLSLGELAVRFGCELRGDPDARVQSVAALETAGPGTVTFLANPRLRSALGGTQATAVVLDARSAAQCPVAALIHANPHATFARMAAVLHPLPPATVGVHASAVVATDAVIDPTAAVGPLTVIGPRCRIGARAVVGPGCTLGADVDMGADSRLVARVAIEQGVRLGARVLVHPGVVLGSDGFGLAREGERWLKVPQIGGVLIGDDVEIGANTTVDRGAIGDTVIEEGVKLDNLIQVAHNARIGAHTAIAACTGIAGSTDIGRRCMIGGGVGFAGHIRICDDVIITGMTMVTRSITEPGMYSSGLPVAPSRIWRRTIATLRRMTREPGQDDDDE